MVLHDVYHGGGEVARLPAEGTAGLEDEVQVRMTSLEVLEGLDEMLHVVVLACDQVSTTHIEPLGLFE